MGQDGDRMSEIDSELMVASSKNQQKAEETNVESKTCYRRHTDEALMQILVLLLIGEFVLQL